MTTFGSYELLRRLGTGGTAEVYLAAAPGRGEEQELIALKIVLPHLAEDGRLRETLLHEASIAARVRHPNVVEIYEVGEAEGRPFLAMEFVRGWPLNTFLKRLAERDQALTMPEVCAIVREAALGVHCAHEATDEKGRPLGLIHRDISPHNLILRDDGRVKVVDFGLAKATLASGTQTGGMKGKIAYMPPEQIEGKPLDRRVDVFALGAVFWELLAGEKLHPGRTEAEILQQAMFQPQRRLDRVAPGLPRELVELVEAALERDVEQRLPSALELAQALAPWLSETTKGRLTHRLQSLFDPLPRTVAEARDPSLLRRSTGEQRHARSSGERAIHKSGEHRPAPPAGERRAHASGERPAHKSTGEHRPTRASGEHRPARSPDERAAAYERPPVSRTARTADRTTIQPSPFAPEEPAAGGPPDEDEDASPQWAKTALDKKPVHQAPAPRRGALVAVGVLGAAAVLGLGLLALRPGRSAPASAEPPPPQVHTLEGQTGPVPIAPKVPASSPEPAAAPHPPHGGKASLVLRSNVGAFVFEDGKNLGMTPMTLPLPPGAHHLELKATSGSGSKGLDITLQPGQQLSRTVELPQG